MQCSDDQTSVKKKKIITSVQPDEADEMVDSKLSVHNVMTVVPTSYEEEEEEDYICPAR